MHDKVIIMDNNNSDWPSHSSKDLYFPLEHESDLDALMNRIGDSKYVLLGEASHGTHEYYTWRAKISKRLIEEKGFSFIAVEGDWPDCYKLNQWIKKEGDQSTPVSEILSSFNRWPTWMWANWEIAALAEWLRDFNSHLPLGDKIGFYGLDVYSLWESLETLITYLEKEDPQTAFFAKEVADCFEPYRKNDSYIDAYRGLNPNCKREVTELLGEVRKNASTYDSEQEGPLNAEMNALVMKNADKYYEAMLSFDNHSWNVRDSHMMETLNALMKFHKKDAKVIVWEHNTHIGDARYTDMASVGMHNVGQLVREQHDKEGVILVGFGSYKGSVIAGENWGGPMKIMTLPSAKRESVEYKLHKHFAGNKMLIFDDEKKTDTFFNEKHGHRAVGVVYDPSQEWGNYVPTILAKRYDVFLYIDKTTALHPLHFKPDGDKMPETYPFGV